MKYKVVIYGIGEQYNRNFNILKYFEVLGQFEIVGITAKWTPDACYLDGHRIIKYENLFITEFEYIVIMSDIFFGEIVTELVQKGVSRSKLLSYRVLQIQNLDFGKYIEFKKSNISIVSNNCWGGVICHTLGIECLSPFKNLSVEENDYIKLVSNFRYYMGCEMKFLQYAYNKNSKKEYPVMSLDDVKIHCNHDTEPLTALNNWNRRRDKINYDNVLFEMYTENIDVMEQFFGIEGLEKRLCFVPFATEEKDAYRLSMYPGQKYFWETVNSNAGNGPNCIEYNCLSLVLGMSAGRRE